MKYPFMVIDLERNTVKLSAREFVSLKKVIEGSEIAHAVNEHATQTALFDEIRAFLKSGGEADD